MLVIRETHKFNISNTYIHITCQNPATDGVEPCLGLRKMAPQHVSIWHPERRLQVYILTCHPGFQGSNYYATCRYIPGFSGVFGRNHKIWSLSDVLHCFGAGIYKPQRKGNIRNIR